MNLNKGEPMRRLAFRAWRSLTVIVPGRRFGLSAEAPARLERSWSSISTGSRGDGAVTRELGRFRTSRRRSIDVDQRRLAAVDAARRSAARQPLTWTRNVSNRRSVARATRARLAECFAEDEPVQMTRQEVAVARSTRGGLEAVATGTNRFVLVLEDDVWFTPGRPPPSIAAARRPDRCVVEGGRGFSTCPTPTLAGRGPRRSLRRPLPACARSVVPLGLCALAWERRRSLSDACRRTRRPRMNFRLRNSVRWRSFARDGAEARGGSDNAYSVLRTLPVPGSSMRATGAEPPDLPSGPVLAWTGGRGSRRAWPWRCRCSGSRPSVRRR